MHVLNYNNNSGGGLGSEKAIQRIVELSKKNRELQCKLGSETAAKNKLAERINNQVRLFLICSRHVLCFQLQVISHPFSQNFSQLFSYYVVTEEYFVTKFSLKYK